MFASMSAMGDSHWTTGKVCVGVDLASDRDTTVFAKHHPDGQMEIISSWKDEWDRVGKSLHDEVLLIQKRRRLDEVSARPDYRTRRSGNNRKLIARSKRRAANKAARKARKCNR